MQAAAEARWWICAGRVQGVGFRPFVYRIAHRHRLEGWVRNLAGQVEILAQGAPDDLDRFGAALLAEAPPAADPHIVALERRAAAELGGFAILDSDATAAADVHIPPDTFPCADCLAELAELHDRRYRHPFINCTQCGPRYTLIRALPYDRSNTTMADFPLCPACAAEYGEPGDRRFHAEPLACPACGPQLRFGMPGVAERTGETALRACVEMLAAGRIVAVKGVGGYHLMCDAASEPAVATLRLRKRRPDKPLAVMFPPDTELAAIRRCALPTPQHEALLRSASRPIVLLPARAGATLAAGLAPGCGEIGAMLPGSPLHHLLLQDFGAALVATSGNVSGEPMLTDPGEAERRLAGIADAFLHHDRPIARPADDPVCRVIDGRPRMLRLGRGVAPHELELPFALPRPVLALGGHLKNTLALGWGRRAVLSQHLGDMGSPRALALLQEVAADLQKLYDVEAQQLLCDAHPDYATTRLAARWGLPVRRISHHRAHASALAGEQAPSQLPWLVFAWDGAGFGDDGTLWGGEALFGTPGHWRRVASFRTFSLPGGERAAREPWRSALSLLWEAGRSWAVPERPAEDVALLRRAWERRLHCPQTSSVGRLFDAAAALLRLNQRASYEGQAPMLLEAACSTHTRVEPLPLPLRRRADGLWFTDWEPLIEPLLDDARSVAERATLFHASLAHALLEQARVVRREHGAYRLGATGGVFQNRRLAEQVAHLAAAEGLELAMPESIPANDGGLSFGQLIEYGATP